MIDIKRKEDCCGCEACHTACPHGCITLSADEEGFLYPHITLETCVHCDLCERVCPVINKHTGTKPDNVLATFNPDDKVRQDSSSGGIFSMLAEKVISQGGIVFGAAYDENWQVKHISVDTLEGLARLRGSKYVQSQMGDTFRQAREALRQERPVLFSGTPCHINALRLYLHREYDNLLCVDFVCHGVPSPLVWRDYLSSLGLSRISSVTMRSKKEGWKKYGFKVDYQDSKGESSSYFSPFAQNNYLHGFVNNLYLRPSCHECPIHTGHPMADITLGDLWGAQHLVPNLDDDRGLSLVIGRTPRGHKMLADCGIKGINVKYAQVVRYNGSLEESSAVSQDRQYFWHKYRRIGIHAIEHTLHRRATIDKWLARLSAIRRRLLP